MADSDYTDIKVPELEDGLKYHCFVAFSSKDLDVVTDLVEYLTKRCKYKVCTFYDFGLGGFVLDDIEEGVKKSRRSIVLMSAAYRESAYYDHETLLMIHNNADHKQQRIIPVCLGLTEEQMKETRLGVYNFQYIDYNMNNEAHKRKIAEAVAGPDIQLSVSLPCGSVAQGLAWSFYYGYIKLILPGLVDRCNRSKWANHETIPLIPKVFILIPDNGFCHSSITDCDPNISSEGSMEPIERCRAGIYNRSYKNTMYKVKGSMPGEEYFTLCEYATPVLSMYEMHEEGIAGLTEEEMRHQISHFGNLLDQILSQQMCQEPGESYVFKIISFKADSDGRGDVSSVIVDSIKKIEEENTRRAKSVAGGQSSKSMAEYIT